MARSQPSVLPAARLSEQPRARTNGQRWLSAMAVIFVQVFIVAACGSANGSTQPDNQPGDSQGNETGSTTDETTTDEADETDATPGAETDEPSSDATGSLVELVSGSIEVDGGLITTVRADGSYAKSTVLFLHGAAYTSQTWVQNEILAAVAKAGIDTIAIDLPGSGTSGRTGLEDEEFLTGLFVALDLDPATTIVVSPSMSGGFSLPALRQPFFADLAGYVPVAPVGVSGFTSDGPALDIPALVVWGDGDGSDPQGSAEALASSFTNSTILILPDAGHAAYQQQPELFAQALIDFVVQNEAG